MTEVKASRSHRRASGVKLDSNEIWEWLFGRLKGDVPSVLDDSLLSELAEHINTHFNASIQSCLVAEGVEPIDGRDPMEIAARAICAVKGINPDAAHFGTSDRDVQDGTFPDGKPFYFGWRNQVKYAEAVREALSQAQGEGV